MKKENTEYTGCLEKVLYFNFENQGPYNFWELGATGNLVAKDGGFMSLFNQGGIFRGIGYYQESKLKLFAIILFTRH